MLGIEGKALKMVKSIYGKPPANITLHSEQLNAVLDRFYQATSSQHFPGSSNQCKEAKRERHTDWKEVQLSLFTWHDPICRKSQGTNNNNNTIY